VVVGQFKRGKTSLLNAIVGRRFFRWRFYRSPRPSPTLRFGDRPGATVHFENGSRSRWGSIGCRIRHEAGNPRNVSGSPRGSRYPSASLRDGVVLIDTPGIPAYTPQHAGDPGVPAAHRAAVCDFARAAA